MILKGGGLIETFNIFMLVFIKTSLNYSRILLEKSRDKTTTTEYQIVQKVKKFLNSKRNFI